jgi:hypothetical protein
MDDKAIGPSCDERLTLVAEKAGNLAWVDVAEAVVSSA